MPVNPPATGDLELAFDVGHSSIGWAAFATATLEKKSATSSFDLLGCGVVTFPPDDCLANAARRYRQQRRHTRATRLRIQRMETLLVALGALSHQEATEKHQQGKGHAAPWLLASRVLAARSDKEKEQARLSWSELWDVLRWYAHNRGYDAHIRFSDGFKVRDFAVSPVFDTTDIEAEAERAEEQEQSAGDGSEADSEKLRAGAELMGDRFSTQTFGETVAKLLLGPPRAIKPGQPGKPGKVEDAQQPFSEADFRKLLFTLDNKFRNHPRHLANYFKGVRAAFPRRIVKDGVLVGGTEWEVRYILRAHFGFLRHCDETFETAICGGMPETKADWQVYRSAYSTLYLSDSEITEAKKLRIPRMSPKQQKAALLAKRRLLFKDKLALPARFEGGLLFGGLAMRFHNRIISTCRFTYARVVEAILTKDDKALMSLGGRMADVEKSRRTCKNDRELDVELARRWAAKLAKVPSKNSPEFLLYRWGMKLADLTVKRAGHPNLLKEERSLLHERMKLEGFLSRASLADAVRQITGSEPANLEQTFDATPEAAESLVIHPVRKYLATNELAKTVDAKLNPNLRRRLAGKLRNGKSIRIKEIESWLPEQERAGFIKAVEAITTNLNKAQKLARKTPEDGREDDISESKPTAKRKVNYKDLCRTSLKAPLASGRAPFSRVILREAFEQVLRGEDPRKPKCDSEKKAAHGCLFQTPAINRYLLMGAVTGSTAAEAFERWKARWLSHEKNRTRYENRERKHPGSGDELLRSEFVSAQSQSWLSQQTNNHKVRHRLLILERLLRDIIAEPKFGAGDPNRVKKVSLEVARDILAFAGLERKQLTGRVLPALKAHHEYIAKKKLPHDLKGTKWEHSINGEMIWKAKIADDLGWRCPYTNQPFCACDIATGKMDIDHIIPKSQRLTNAMEALVITYKTINNVKGDLTAWEFVDKYQGTRIDGVHQPVQMLWSYEQFVSNKENESNKLILSGETGHRDYPKWPKFFPGSREKLHPDYIRRKKRRQYLLLKHFEKDKERFQPRDLTITSHLNRLAQQVVLRALPNLPEHQVISVPGSVTGTLRDARGWGLLGCLDGTASSEVMRLVQRQKKNTEVLEEVRIPKPKGEIRDLTHLHHALDACIIGMITYIVPKDGKLWELAAKGELDEADVKAFEQLRKKYLDQFPPRDLYQMFQVVQNTDRGGNLPKHNHKWRLEPMPLKNVLPQIKWQIRECLSQRRVVQHLPSDMSGLVAKETIWRVFDPEDKHPSAQRLRHWFDRASVQIPAKGASFVLIVTRKRRDAKGEDEDKGETLYDTGKVWRWVYLKIEKSKLVGLTPTNGTGKLAAQKGVKIVGENFGMALFPNAARSAPRYKIVRMFNVCRKTHRDGLREANGGVFPEILRKGHLISTGKGDYAGTVWRILGIEETGRVRFCYSDIPRRIDKPNENFKSVQISSFIRDGLKILKPSYVGMPSCPTTSSASMPRNAP